jgi:hypothetical protein
LVKLAIEHLERMKASGKCNYDYVVLQATDNSIPFYESMGFVRVGALAKEESVDEEQEGPNNHSNNDSGEVSSNVIWYTVKKPGEPLTDIARKVKADVWDLIFLNKDAFPDLVPSSRLWGGTLLLVPVEKKIQEPPKQRDPVTVPQWYVAKEDETPRMIARKFNVSCLDVVEANKARLAGLMSNSRLKEGTRLKVSHLSVHEGDYKPYAHWTFPGDQYDEPEPSYMMALKLNRCRGQAAKRRPFLESLATTLTPYTPTPLLLPPSPEPPRLALTNKVAVVARTTSTTTVTKKQRHPQEPIPPKRPLWSFALYATKQREIRPDIKHMAFGKSSKILADEWNHLPPAERRPYEMESTRLREEYVVAKAKYEKELQAFKKAHPNWEQEKQELLSEPVPATTTTTRTTLAQPRAPVVECLYNIVVKLKEGAMTEGANYTYWYVLTFIPDLRWCHLAPMISVGNFGSDKPKCNGRPRWKLEDESLGRELDISSSFCIPIKSRCMKKTEDADKEEWDIIDDGSDPYAGKVSRSLLSSSSEYQGIVRFADLGLEPRPETTTTTKQTSELPMLVATHCGKNVRVKLTGVGLLDPSFTYRQPRMAAAVHSLTESFILSVYERGHGAHGEGMLVVSKKGRNEGFKMVSLTLTVAALVIASLCLK